MTSTSVAILIGWTSFGLFFAGIFPAVIASATLMGVFAIEVLIIYFYGFKLHLAMSKSMNQAGRERARKFRYFVIAIGTSIVLMMALFLICLFVDLSIRYLLYATALFCETIVLSSVAYLLSDAVTKSTSASTTEGHSKSRSRGQSASRTGLSRTGHSRGQSLGRNGRHGISSKYNIRQSRALSGNFRKQQRSVTFCKSSETPTLHHQNEIELPRVSAIQATPRKLNGTKESSLLLSASELKARNASSLPAQDLMSKTMLEERKGTFNGAAEVKQDFESIVIEGETFKV